MGAAAGGSGSSCDPPPLPSRMQDSRVFPRTGGMRRADLIVVAPTAASAEPAEHLVKADDPLTAVAEKAQRRYNDAIDGLCKRVEEGAKEEGELAPIVPYDPDSDAPNQCLIVDEEQRPMPLHLCQIVLSELDLPRAAMGVARVLIARAVCIPRLPCKDSPPHSTTGKACVRMPIREAAAVRVQATDNKGGVSPTCASPTESHLLAIPSHLPCCRAGWLCQNQNNLQPTGCKDDPFHHQHAEERTRTPRKPTRHFDARLAFMHP